MSSVRDRTVAHLKKLAAATVVAGCHGAGYGVVDPMPSPACFESPSADVTAKILEHAEDGTRVVELIVKFTQTDAKFTEIGAKSRESGGGKLAITEQQINANDVRAVIRVPKGVIRIELWGSVTSPSCKTFSTGLDVAADTVTVSYVW